MTNRLIARQRECEELQSCMDSNESEFVIVCGRRRIGKTFLVEQFFEGKYAFKFVGGHNLRTRDQLNNFAKALKAYFQGMQRDAMRSGHAQTTAISATRPFTKERQRAVTAVRPVFSTPWRNT